jgi:hypothetical protein
MTAAETSLTLSIPASSSSPVLSDTGNTGSSQDRNEEDNDALPMAQRLDATPDFLKRVQSLVAQQRNEVVQVAGHAEHLDNNASATEQQQQGRQLRKVLIGVAILFVLILVASLLVVFLREPSDPSTTTGQDDNLTGGSSVQEDNNVTVQEDNNVTASIQTIVALLQSYNVTENNDPSSSWSNDESDSYRAVEWMSKNIARPNQLSPKAIVQYYALATLYFALGGEGWERKTNWLRPPSFSNSSFCAWQKVQCSGDNSVTGLDLGT